ncbi:MAG: PAS domain-containing protein [Verrucomicrobia bacterium]|nr:PAS domain-containing protein [Verrucomicrobiota bacterium]
MAKSDFTALWKQYEPMIKAIVELFHPFAEAAVHDLEKGRIVALYHNLSQRNVGDRSPLHELKVETKDFPDYFEPYYKENRDGRPLKCTSITLRNSKGKAIGLICINVDVSAFQETRQALERFLKTPEKARNPVELYGGQCEEQVTAIIQGYLDDNRLKLNFLDRERKKQIVQHLFQKGIFNYKNAVPFIAKKLKISRASIYNYIKEV